MPLLHEHSREAVIGSITSAVNDGRSIEIEGELFTDLEEAAAKLAAKAKRGIGFQMSVGLFDAKAKTESGRVRLNGREHKGPLIVLHGGTIREVSVVTLGADPATSAELFSAGRPAESLEDVDRIYAARHPRLAQAPALSPCEMLAGGMIHGC
jgi:hypothetical protein